MKINFLGKTFEVSIKSNQKSKNTKSFSILNDTKTHRILIYILIVSIFFIFSTLKNNVQTYNIGDIAKNDVIAYKDLTYTKDILDDELKAKIKQNTTPEYDRIEDVDKDEIDKLDQFFQDLNQVDLNNDTKIKELISIYELDLKVSDVRTIGINKGVKYYLFLINVLNELYTTGIYKTSDVNKILSEKQIVLTDEEKKLIMNFVKPNLEINKAKTLNKIEKNMERLKNNVVSIKKGDIILREGGVITDSIYNNLEHLGYINAKDVLTRIFGQVLLYAISSVIFIAISYKYLRKSFNSKSFYPLIITVALIDFLYLFLFNSYDLKYLAPFLLLPLIGSVLDKNHLFIFIITSFNYIFVLGDYKWTAIILLLSIMVMNINSNVSNRNQIVKNSIYIGLIQSFFAIAYGFASNSDLIEIIPNIIASIISGILTGIFSLGLIPYFENSFNILTDIKLLELSNFSNDLLKNLLLVSPGTFHHSIMVGALAEAGAESIGADSILCRVASYYHDIGKMKRPEYFVENQYGIVNPHNKLKPTLSALIITSHTKDGYFLGKQYGLPKEILDIILEHHGTTLVQYFYYKALESGEEVTEDSFRYQGPRPRSKESGIIMMADTIEAAVRASSDKSYDSIEKLVRYLIKSKIEDNQLSDCNITLGEIEKVINAFLNVLRGIYHERIQYKNIK
ncbi:HD family phosphohydrolase [Pseudostreptobacillus hongkongensis]|uniref:HD family phosphohydrolase n=1 Tax=Pseudostreptobacillus hongkongensis TaxID=1162717 RepID=UPI00082C2F71|nr:HDIG domain-containing metalloprotein [Pseudostreptobacillus hongkongensis]